MRAYRSFFRIRFSNGLQYRAAALAGVVTQFFWGGLELLLFYAFYRTDPSAFPMGFSQLSSYIWLQQAFLTLFMFWILDKDAFDAITTGNVAYELARPMDLYNQWFVKNVALRASKAALRCVPVLAVAALLPAPFGLSAPADPAALGLFALTMVLALGAVVAFCMLIYIATFYTLSSVGVRTLALSLSDLLTGSIIPIPFMPDGFRRFVELTPFAGMQNLPFRIYSGHIAGWELIQGIGLQIFWLAVLVGIGRLWMARALRRVVVQGG